MVRAIAGVVGGLVLWIIIATIGNLIVRLSWPAYAQVEIAMTFTLGMLIARLVLGLVSSLLAGLAVARITNRNRVASWVLVVLLLTIFVPVHAALWERFPIWYHLAFLGSLAVVPLLGASLYQRRFDRKGSAAA
jgi:hypothetical protein